MISTELLQLINTVRKHKGLPVMITVTAEMRLRQEIALDSLDLAELTVRIEDKFGVDIFADGVVFTVGEVQAKLGAIES